MSVVFERGFTALPGHIDAMGHVNNAVWVQWIQDVATAHWDAAARTADRERFAWLVVRHEIDYRGNIASGESVTAKTWIDGPARGARSRRRVEFRDAAGKTVVSATTDWAMIDRSTGRPMRIRADLLAPFLP